MPGRKTDRARKMREDPTEAEARLWYYLRNRQVEGAKFRRQEPILGYFADFLCEEARLIVVADGGQQNGAIDSARTASLEAAGYLVVRFWNNDILNNTEGVIDEIRRILRQARAHR